MITTIQTVNISEYNLLKQTCFFENFEFSESFDEIYQALHIDTVLFLLFYGDLN